LGGPANLPYQPMHYTVAVSIFPKQLAKAKLELEENGIVVEGTAVHVITHSLYLRDPDGNELELYIDWPEYDWKTNNEWLNAPVRPLEL